jgi:hypothetical protein
MISTFVLATLLAADAPATTAEAAPPAPEEAKMICRRIAEIGSRVRAQRICKTKQEWATEREENRRMIDRAQTQRGTAGAN